MDQIPGSVQAYHRITKYLNHLNSLPQDGGKYISSSAIAAALDINDVVVRKDLAFVSGNGKPKVGYEKEKLIMEIRHFLGHDNLSDAVLVGIGHLGQALLNYRKFEQYGLRIAAAFDQSADLIGKEIGGIKIADAAKITDICARMSVKIGIITVPENAAQEVCNALVAGGIRAVWNFAPVNLKTPDTVAVKNEDMAVSLAMLTNELSKILVK